MTQVRLDLNEYTIRVLDVIKGKFGLKNRTDAVNIFAKLYGEDYADPIVNELVLREVDAVYETHIKKKNRKPMTMKELDSLLELHK